MVQVVMPDDEVCYRILKASDSRFDGLFFAASLPSGIYCRAVCPATPPEIDRLRFYPTAAAAEAAGFRPCLKCRPDLAPGVRGSMDSRNIARRAADLIRDGSMPYIASLASTLAVSERQLRRVFFDEYGVSPVEYRNTCRLLLAVGLLADTDLPITRIAFACGFSSVRRLNDVFLERYSMSPSAFRRAAAEDTSYRDKPIVVHLGYRPPYRFDLLLRLLQITAIPGVEVVTENAYMRTVELSSDSRATVGWIRIEDHAEENRLALTLSPALLNELPTLVERVRHMVDVDCMPDLISEGLHDFYACVPRAYHIPGVRLPGSLDAFEATVYAILARDCGGDEARRLAGSISRALGKPIDTRVEGLELVFPRPERFLGQEMGELLIELGIPQETAGTIIGFARAMSSGEIPLHPGVDVEAVGARLAEMPGFDQALAQYLLLRIFGYPDCLLEDDIAVRSVFPDLTRQQLAEESQAWRPWRSYVLVSIWSAVCAGGLPVQPELGD